MSQNARIGKTMFYIPTLFLTKILHETIERGYVSLALFLCLFITRVVYNEYFSCTRFFSSGRNNGFFSLLCSG